jgi:hypothetical protein
MDKFSGAFDAFHGRAGRLAQQKLFPLALWGLGLGWAEGDRRVGEHVQGRERDEGERAQRGAHNSEDEGFVKDLPMNIMPNELQASGTQVSWAWIVDSQLL